MGNLFFIIRLSNNQKLKTDIDKFNYIKIPKILHGKKLFKQNQQNIFNPYYRQCLISLLYREGLQIIIKNTTQYKNEQTL